jgi:hypothetical protein
MLRPLRGRKFTPQVPREQLLARTSDALRGNGVDHHSQASLMFGIARVALESDSPLLAVLRARPKLRDTAAWARAYTVATRFLEQFAMELTAQILRSELGDVHVIPDASALRGTSSSQFLGSLVRFATELAPDPLEHSVAVFAGQRIIKRTPRQAQSNRFFSKPQPQRAEPQPQPIARPPPKVEEPKPAEKAMPRREEPKPAALPPRREEPKPAALPPRREEPKPAPLPPTREEPKPAPLPPKREEPKPAPLPPKREEPKPAPLPPKREEPKPAALPPKAAPKPALPPPKREEPTPVLRKAVPEPKAAEPPPARVPFQKPTIDDFRATPTVALDVDVASSSVPEEKSSRNVITDEETLIEDFASDEEAPAPEAQPSSSAAIASDDFDVSVAESSSEADEVESVVDEGSCPVASLRSEMVGESNQMIQLPSSIVGSGTSTRKESKSDLDFEFADKDDSDVIEIEDDFDD